jgi:hypothetical protein
MAVSINNEKASVLCVFLKAVFDSYTNMQNVWWESPTSIFADAKIFRPRLAIFALRFAQTKI